LKHYATSRKVAVSIPVGVIGIFYSHNHFGRTIALVSTQPLIEKNKGKGKGKAIPLQAWTGPEGSRRVRLPDFKTIGT